VATPAQRRQSAKALHALERQLTHGGAQRPEPGRSEGTEAGTDPDTQPLTEMLQAIASNRNANHSALLARVRRALEKLEDGPDDFGVCEDCGDPIPWGRLQAMPFAERCVACQAQQDGPRGPATRRHLTDFR
jgi:DnaK suppressor protein